MTSTLLPEVPATPPEPPAPPEPASIPPRVLLPSLAARDQDAVVLGRGCSPASVSLSQDFSALITHGGSLLTHDELGGRGLSTRRAWDAAAHNLIALAQTQEGTRFWLRPAEEILGPGCPAGVQIDTDGAAATAWLAHPETFTLLDRHLRAVLGAQSFRYLAPREEILLALDTDSATARDSAEFALSAGAFGSSSGAARPLATAPLIWQRGFPAVSDSFRPSAAKN